MPNTDEVVYFSCTEAGFDLFKYLVDDYDIEEIVSLTIEQADANNVSGYYNFKEIANSEDIPIYHPEEYEMNSQDIEHFRNLGSSVAIVNGWQRLVPGEILDTFPKGVLGIHGSAYGLPQGRGRSPLNWSLIQGLDRFLLSIIRLDEGADSGEIVKTKKFDINDHDDIRSIYYKTTLASQEMLDEVLEDVLEGKHEFVSQSGRPTYYPKRDPEDGGICWEKPTNKVYDLVRAVTKPYPGAYTRYNGTKIYVWEATPFSSDLALDHQPGEVIKVFSAREDFAVSTSDGSLLVREWSAEGWGPKEGEVLESVDVPERPDEPKGGW